MRATSRAVLAVALMIGGSLALGGSPARAQEPGLGGILGGYGAMAGGSGSSMGGGFNIVDPSGMGGSVIVPAAGGSGASMSPSMRGGGLSFRSRPATAMYSARPILRAWIRWGWHDADGRGHGREASLQRSSPARSRAGWASAAACGGCRPRGAWG